MHKKCTRIAAKDEVLSAMVGVADSFMTVKVRQQLIIAADQVVASDVAVMTTEEAVLDVDEVQDADTVATADMEEVLAIGVAEADSILAEVMDTIVTIKAIATAKEEDKTTQMEVAEATKDNLVVVVEVDSKETFRFLEEAKVEKTTFTNNRCKKNKAMVGIKSKTNHTTMVSTMTCNVMVAKNNKNRRRSSSSRSQKSRICTGSTSLVSNETRLAQ